jgi:hypothetical protein
LLIDKVNDRYINQNIFNLFNFTSFGIGDSLNYAKYIEGTITVTVNDETDKLEGPAEIEGKSDKGNFQVKVNFMNNNLFHHDATFLLTENDGTILELQQAYYREGNCTINLSIAYHGASLGFNRFNHFYLLQNEPENVWIYIDPFNNHINVAKLLNIYIYPDLLDANWETKVLAAKQIFNGFSID